MRLRVFLVLFCSPCVFAQSNNQVQLSVYLWRQAAGGVVIGTPSAQPRSVVAVLDSGDVKAYSESGELLWSFFVRGGLCPYIGRSREGLSFICAADAQRRLTQLDFRFQAKDHPVLAGYDESLYLKAGFYRI